jgi:signal transduction histidine kinase
LDSSKLEANKIEIVLEPTKIKDLLNGVIQMNKARAFDKGIYLKLLMCSTIPDYLEVDKNRMIQFLMNFISNSIKFTQSGGITLKVDWFPSSDTIISNQNHEIINELLQFSDKQEINHANQCNSILFFIFI